MRQPSRGRPTALLRRTCLMCGLAVAFGACAQPRHLKTTGGAPLERIPADWIDLPKAPFVATIVDGKAVLVNRSTASFDSVAAGCVVEDDGAVRIVGELFSQDISHGAYAPGGRVEGLLPMVNNIDWYVANQGRIIGRCDLIKRCPEGSNTALIRARLRDKQEWSAARTPWPK